MQNDLISRSALVDMLLTENQRCITSTGHELSMSMIVNFIENQHITYSIEKVVEELKEWTFNADVNIGDGTLKNSKLIASENAIKIVKRGIVSDDDVCEWKYNDEFEFAKSECGAIDTHRIAFRKLKFCPYCGKKIKVVN